VTQEQLEKLVPKGNRGPLETRERPDRRDKVAPLVIREARESLELLVLDFLVVRGQLDIPVKQVQLVQVVCLGLLEMWDHLDQPGLLEPPARSAILESLVRPVHQDRLT